MHLLLLFSFYTSFVSGRVSFVDLNGGLMEPSEDYPTTKDTPVGSKNEKSAQKVSLNHSDFTKKPGLPFSPVSIRVQRDDYFSHLHFISKPSSTSLFDPFAFNSSSNATHSPSSQSSFFDDENRSKSSFQSSNLSTPITKTIHYIGSPSSPPSASQLSYRSGTWNISTRTEKEDPEKSSNLNGQRLPQLKSPLRFHINQFGLDFLRQVHCGSSLGCNALHSPLSISIAISMLLHGAGPTTSDEIMRFFRYPRTFNSTYDLHHAYQDVRPKLIK